MKNLTCLGLLLGICCLWAAGAPAQTVNSDSWAATDALGRKVREYKEAGDKKKDKLVAMFYWTWHTDFVADGDGKPVQNITETLRKYPEAAFDYNHPAWKHGTCFWEQPLFGYYRTTDPWVLRKHAEMLADAGVDVVFFDCTNGSYTWKSSYDALMKVWDQAQKDGVNVPKIAFMLPFAPLPASQVSIRQLYNDIYKRKRYENLWFVWQGKPCIMAYPESLLDTPSDREIAEFFTFRPGQPDYVDGPSRNDQWGWLENYPQHGYVKGPDGKFELVTVGVAQNATAENGGHAYAFNAPKAFGRSFSMQKGFDPRVDGYLYGWNFQEQWSRAFELDPQIVFVTGWNEFTAGQHENWPPSKPHKPFAFPDQYDWNCSRDIEPNAGWVDKGDVYYMQLIDNVRKFKGMTPPEKASAPKTIEIGKAGEWDDVAPYFASYKGNTMHRNHKGHDDTHYTNNTGRNDIVGAKVARDKDNLYFYVETADKLTPSTDRNWMMLLIDVDRDKATGWNGYDLIVNRVSPHDGLVVIEKNVGNRWEWEKAGESRFAVNGNSLEFAVTKALMGLSGNGVDIEFKWNDNMQENGNIMDFYVNGDTAPGGRFNYVYTAK